MRPRVSTLIVALGMLAAVSGDACIMAEARVDRSSSSDPSKPAGSQVDRCAPIDKLDLLLTVDNSNFMTGAQTSLKQALPRILVRRRETLL